MNPEENRESGRKIKTFFEREEWKKGRREIEGERQVDQLCSLGWSGIPNQLLTVNRWGGWGLQDPPYSLVGSL